LNRILIGAYRKGCKFDGWSDKFHYGLWKDAFDEERIDPDFFTVRGRDIYEPLPWDHIDNRIDKSFLKQEWENALKEKLTDDCRHGKCHQCGTCDFEEIKVRTYPAFGKESAEVCRAGDGADAGFKKLYVYYSKLGQAKYFGHLELVNIFLRALMRSKIPLKYSQGFHPKPKISFNDPLPVGIESRYESFVMTVPDSVLPETVACSLNTQLPDGLAVLSCQPAPPAFQKDDAEPIDYMITLKEGNFDRDKLSYFFRSPDLTITISNRKGKLKKINLKDMVVNIDLLDSSNLRLTLSSGKANIVRPALILRHIFNVAEEQIKQAKIVKLKAQGREHRA